MKIYIYIYSATNSSLFPTGTRIHVSYAVITVKATTDEILIQI